MSPSPARCGTHRKWLAGALRRRRMEFGRALLGAVQDLRTASWKRPLTFDQLGEWGRAHLLAAVDLLERWFATESPLFLELFDGWVRSRMAADLSEEPLPDDYQPAHAVERAAAAWVQMLRPTCPASGIEILQQDLGDAIARSSAPTLKRLNVLFVGDCLHFEVITALLGPCAARIEVSPSVLNEKAPVLLRNGARALPPDRFDLVFLSPFSHRFFPEYDALLRPQSAFWSAGQWADNLGRLLDEARAAVQTLTAHFECPVYVHNTAGAVQSFGPWSGALRIWRRGGPEPGRGGRSTKPSPAGWPTRRSTRAAAPNSWTRTP